MQIKEITDKWPMIQNLPYMASVPVTFHGSLAARDHNAKLSRTLQTPGAQSWCFFITIP